MLEIAKMVETMSEGRLVFDVFTGGEICPATEEIEALHDGVLDATANPTVWSMELFPAAGLFFQMGGGMTPIPQAMWYLEGGGFELCQEMYEPLDVYVCQFFNIRNPEVWVHSTVPLATPADFEGLKMRALGDPAEIIARMGAATTFMHGGEIYEAAQRGVIDAFEMGPFGPNWKMGFQEVAKYIYQSPSRGPTDLALFFVNEKVWNETPADLRNMVETASWIESFSYYAVEVAAEVGFKRQFIDYGCIVEPLPEAIETAFLAEAEKFYDEKGAADPFFAKVVKSQREFKAITDALGIH